MKKLFVVIALPLAIGFAMPVIAQVDSSRATDPDRSTDRPTIGAAEQEVATAVRRAIDGDQALSTSAARVAVRTEGATVVLSGQVKSAQDKARIVSLAKQAPNVQFVDDRIEVQP